MVFAVKSVTRDDERPIRENMSLRSELVGGFVVRFTEPLQGSGRMHVRATCPACGRIGIEDRSSSIDKFVSATIGGGPCVSCRSCMLALQSHTSDDEPNVIVFAVELKGGIGGTAIRKELVGFEVVRINDSPPVSTDGMDEAALCSTIKNADLDNDTRYAAMKKLDRSKWQQFFFEIATRDPDVNLRYVAVKYLDERRFLSQIAKSRDDHRVVHLANFRLDNPGVKTP